MLSRQWSISWYVWNLTKPRKLVQTDTSIIIRPSFFAVIMELVHVDTSSLLLYLYSHVLIHVKFRDSKVLHLTLERFFFNLWTFNRNQFEHYNSRVTYRAEFVCTFKKEIKCNSRAIAKCQHIWQYHRSCICHQF